MTHWHMESWSANLVNLCCRPHQHHYPARSSEKPLVGRLGAFNTPFWRLVWRHHFWGVGILGKTSGGLLGTSSTSVSFLSLNTVFATGSSLALASARVRHDQQSMSTVGLFILYYVVFTWQFLRIMVRIQNLDCVSCFPFSCLINLIIIICMYIHICVFLCVWGVCKYRPEINLRHCSHCHHLGFSLNTFFIFCFAWVGSLPGSVHHMCKCPGDQRGHFIPSLELGLQKAVNHTRVLTINTRSPGRVGQHS